MADPMWTHHIDTYFFKIHPYIVLPPRLRPPKWSLSWRFTCLYFESTPTFLHSGYMLCPSRSSRFNHPDYISWTVQTMKFLIVKPSALSIRYPLWLKYSSQDPVFKYLSLHFSLNATEHVSQPYSTTGNIIVLYILIFKFLERSLDKRVYYYY